MFKPSKTVNKKPVPKTMSFRPKTDEFYHRVWEECQARDMNMNDFLNQAIQYALDSMDSK